MEQLSNYNRFYKNLSFYIRAYKKLVLRLLRRVNTVTLRKRRTIIQKLFCLLLWCLTSSHFAVRTGLQQRYWYQSLNPAPANDIVSNDHIQILLQIFLCISNPVLVSAANPTKLFLRFCDFLEYQGTFYPLTVKRRQFSFDFLFGNIVGSVIPSRSNGFDRTCLHVV